MKVFIPKIHNIGAQQDVKEELRRLREKYPNASNQATTELTFYIRDKYYDEVEVEELPAPIDWAGERQDVLDRFLAKLQLATGDGSKKRQAGLKPAWYEDQGHMGAIFSHLTKYFRGEKVDPDSGTHPMVHVAWRALAIACTETQDHQPHPVGGPLLMAGGYTLPGGEPGA